MVPFIAMADVIKIATVRGSLTDPVDLAIRLFSFLREGVHTEIWWGGYRFFSAGWCNGVGVLQESDGYDAADWDVVEVPVSDIDVALGFVDAALESSVPYGVNPVECALHYCRDDLDCCRPDTWDRVFCSQFALLFLRWCAVHGVLVCEDAKPLWSVNSRGCLPCRLTHILGEMGLFNCYHCA